MITRLASKFRAAWEAADAEGEKGKRVERGLNAVLFDAVFAYSEWLDGQGLVVPADAHLHDDDRKPDERTHEELALAFLVEMNK